MKVVDMFGAGLPVCAVRFPCIGELVRHGVNGLVFDRDQPEQLADQILECLAGEEGGGGERRLRQLRRGVEETRRDGWEENWRNVAAEFFRD